MKIQLGEYELREVMKDTDLSKLELLGVIAALNRFLPSSEQDRQRREDDRMGRDYC